MIGTAEIIRRARAAGIVVPAFNIPYLPMAKPVIQAVAEEDSFALIQVARLEWEKFSSRSLAGGGRGVPPARRPRARAAAPGPRAGHRRGPRRAWTTWPIIRRAHRRSATSR